MRLKPLLYLCFTPLNIPILSIVNTLLHHVIVSSYREFYHDTIYIRSCLPPLLYLYSISTLLYLYSTMLYYLPHITLTTITSPFTTLLYTTHIQYITKLLLLIRNSFTSIEYFTL